MTETIDLAGADGFPVTIPTAAAEVLNPYRPAWHDDSLCSQTDPDAFYPDKGESTKAAKRVCAACPAQQLCLEWALENREPFGVWGGKSERERRLILKERQEAADMVTSTDARFRGPRVAAGPHRAEMIRVAEEQGLPTSVLAEQLRCSTDAASVARSRYRAKTAGSRLRATG